MWRDFNAEERRTCWTERGHPALSAKPVQTDYCQLGFVGLMKPKCCPAATETGLGEDMVSTASGGTSDVDSDDATEAPSDSELDGEESEDIDFRDDMFDQLHKSWEANLAPNPEPTMALEAGAEGAEAPAMPVIPGGGINTVSRRCADVPFLFRRVSHDPLGKRSVVR